VVLVIITLSSFKNGNTVKALDSSQKHEQAAAWHHTKRMCVLPGILSAQILPHQQLLDMLG
jgi:hypothetical protein